MKSAAMVTCLWLAACTPLSQRLTASVDEYSAYRRYRTADRMRYKLSAGADYLRHYPAGRWKGEVRAWFNRAESIYLRRAWNDPAALRTYVDTVPHSPRAKGAAQRLVELTLYEEHRRRGRRAFDAHVERLSARLAAAEQGRRELINGFSAWAKLLSQVRQWGARTHELDHEFIHAFRLTEPAARCSEDECKKTVTVTYAIPEQRTQSERIAVYDVVLMLSDGGVQGAVLTGSDLFSRIGEAVQMQPIPAEDYGARAEAMAQAIEIVSVAIARTLPESRCGSVAVSPVLLQRRCDGVSFQLIAAPEIGGEDRIVVSPLLAQPE